MSVCGEAVLIWVVDFAMVAELSDRYGEGGFMMEAGFEDEGFVVIMIGVGGEKSK